MGYQIYIHTLFYMAYINPIRRPERIGNYTSPMQLEDDFALIPESQAITIGNAPDAVVRAAQNKRYSFLD